MVALTNLAECVAAQAVVPSPPAQPSPVPEPSPQTPTGPINFSYDCFGVVLSQCCQAGAPDRCEAGREEDDFEILSSSAAVHAVSVLRQECCRLGAAASAGCSRGAQTGGWEGVVQGLTLPAASCAGVCESGYCFYLKASQDPLG